MRKMSGNKSITGLGWVRAMPVAMRCIFCMSNAMAGTLGIAAVDTIAREGGAG